MKTFVRTVAIVLVMVCALAVFVACDDNKGGGETPTPEVKTLGTPQNVELSDAGVLSWSPVVNATSYVVSLNGAEYKTTDTSYQLATDLLKNDIRYSVYAKAQGYADSAKSEEKLRKGDGNKPKPSDDVISISKTEEVKSGQSVRYIAYINGNKAKDGEIVWSISEGNEYATVAQDGTVTAAEVTSDKIIKLVATSAKDSNCFAQRPITISARTELTAEMLAVFDNDRIGFEGYDNIDVYKTDMFGTYLRTYTIPIRTAMDGTNWFAEYEDSSAGIKTGIYYRNINGKANQVSVSFMNDEQFVPMLDEASGEVVSWEDSGLYNNLKNLKVEDFVFDDSTWMWMYKGDEKMTKRIIASATPYEFEVKKWGLGIDKGEIIYIYAQSEDDYQIVEGYKSIQELYVAINTSESVEVPTIGKFTHDEQYDELYGRLQTAIDNMRALDSYTLDFYDIANTQYGKHYQGFVERVTSDLCYFSPYTVKYDNQNQELRTYTDNASYGYKKLSDNFYNSFSENTKANESDPTSYRATRAYNKTFDNARPSFAFSADIFTSYAYNEDEDTYTYYVNENMCGVASTFFYGVGNDINLYGIFAAKGFLMSMDFVPFVVVKDGYIKETCFFYNLGTMYGVVMIQYDNFNATTVPDGVEVNFETRQVPSDWSQLTIIKKNEDSTTTAEDTEVNALDYLKEFLGKDNAGELIPFFGNVLGDSYGFGMMTTKIPGGTKRARNALCLYYDVPLDIDYTINMSLTAVREYLKAKGFVRNQYDEYHDEANGIWIAPMDQSLDFVIYIWKD